MSYLVKKKLPLFFLKGTDLILSLLHKKATFGKLEKVLLCNIAHLGDVVISTTVIPLLKQVLPNVKIGFLCSTSSSCILHDHPDISWLHTVDHWKLSRNSDSKRKKIFTYYLTKTKAAEEIKQIDYDVSIDLYPYFPNAIPLLWKTKIPIRIGYTSGGFGALLTHPVRWENQNQYMAFYQQALLKQLPFEIHSKTIRYSLPFRPFQARWGLAENFLLFHMGSGSPSKHWPEANWRELALSIQNQQIVFTGKGLEENAAIQRVTHRLNHCLNLCDQLPWKDFCSIVSKANQIISVDSAIVHLAEAFSVPCTVIVMEQLYDVVMWTPPHVQRVVCPSAEEIFHKFCSLS